MEFLRKLFRHISQPYEVQAWKFKLWSSNYWLLERVSQARLLSQDLDAESVSNYSEYANRADRTADVPVSSTNSLEFA